MPSSRHSSKSPTMTTTMTTQANLAKGSGNNSNLNNGTNAPFNGIQAPIRLHPKLHHPVSRSWTESGGCIQLTEESDNDSNSQYQGPAQNLLSNKLVLPLFVTLESQDKDIKGFWPNKQWGAYSKSKNKMTNQDSDQQNNNDNDNHDNIVNNVDSSQKGIISEFLDDNTTPRHLLPSGNVHRAPSPLNSNLRRNSSNLTDVQSLQHNDDHDNEQNRNLAQTDQDSEDLGPFSTLITYLSSLVKNFGLKSVMLFGVINDDQKDYCGSQGSHQILNHHCLGGQGQVVCMAIQAIRQRIPSLLIMADVCLCEYTDHGHCGVLKEGYPLSNPHINLPQTLIRLSECALSYAQAGCHWICPSDMMDGRIAYLRNALDSHGYEHVAILSYTSKKASGSLYSPFRLAVKSTFQGNRKRYQHPIGSSSIAKRAYERDVLEGADGVLVKPSLFYTDIIKEYSQLDQLPVAAYIVSGEYKMLTDYGHSCKCYQDVVLESHNSLIRAGAGILISYFTPYLLVMGMDSQCRQEVWVEKREDIKWQYEMGEESEYKENYQSQFKQRNGQNGSGGGTQSQTSKTLSSRSDVQKKSTGTRQNMKQNDIIESDNLNRTGVAESEVRDGNQKYINNATINLSSTNNCNNRQCSESDGCPTSNNLNHSSTGIGNGLNIRNYDKLFTKFTPPRSEHSRDTSQQNLSGNRTKGTNDIDINRISTIESDMKFTPIQNSNLNQSIQIQNQDCNNTMTDDKFNFTSPNNNISLANQNFQNLNSTFNQMISPILPQQGQQQQQLSGSLRLGSSHSLNSQCHSGKLLNQRELIHSQSSLVTVGEPDYERSIDDDGQISNNAIATGNINNNFNSNLSNLKLESSEEIEDQDQEQEQDLSDDLHCVDTKDMIYNSDSECKTQIEQSPQQDMIQSPQLLASPETESQKPLSQTQSYLEPQTQPQPLLKSCMRKPGEESSKKKKSKSLLRNQNQNLVQETQNQDHIQSQSQKTPQPQTTKSAMKKKIIQTPLTAEKKNQNQESRDSSLKSMDSQALREKLKEISGIQLNPPQISSPSILPQSRSQPVTPSHHQYHLQNLNQLNLNQTQSQTQTSILQQQQSNSNLTMSNNLQQYQQQLQQYNKLQQYNNSTINTSLKFDNAASRRNSVRKSGAYTAMNLNLHQDQGLQQYSQNLQSQIQQQQNFQQQNHIGSKNHQSQNLHQQAQLQHQTQSYRQHQNLHNDISDISSNRIPQSSSSPALANLLGPSSSNETSNRNISLNTIKTTASTLNKVFPYVSRGFSASSGSSGQGIGRYGSGNSIPNQNQNLIRVQSESDFDGGPG